MALLQNADAAAALSFALLSRPLPPPAAAALAQRRRSSASSSSPRAPAAACSRGDSDGRHGAAPSIVGGARLPPRARGMHRPRQLTYLQDSSDVESGNRARTLCTANAGARIPECEPPQSARTARASRREAALVHSCPASCLLPSPSEPPGLAARRWRAWRRAQRWVRGARRRRRRQGAAASALARRHDRGCAARHDWRRTERNRALWTCVALGRRRWQRRWPTLGRAPGVHLSGRPLVTVPCCETPRKGTCRMWQTLLQW